MLVSLLAVLDHVPGLASWTATIRAEPDVIPLLDASINDGAAAIVTMWRDALRIRLGQCGIEIRPRATR
jgi:hypothetical protein